MESRKKVVITILALIGLAIASLYIFTAMVADEDVPPIVNDDPAQEQEQEQEQEARTVLLYYYNAHKDVDAEGNILCSEQGLASTTREIPATQTPIEDTIQLLISGDLTDEEESAGLSTEFPLPGVELTSTNLENGTLTLNFNDPQNQTSGGSCRAGILWHQIRATAQQFDEVSEVQFQPEDLFQP